MNAAEITADLAKLAELAQSSAEEWGEITPAKKAVWGYDPLAASLRMQRDLMRQAWHQQKTAG